MYTGTLSLSHARLQRSQYREVPTMIKQTHIWTNSLLYSSERRSTTQAFHRNTYVAAIKTWNPIIARAREQDTCWSSASLCPDFAFQVRILPNAMALIYTFWARLSCTNITYCLTASHDSSSDKLSSTHVNKRTPELRGATFIVIDRHRPYV